MPFSKLPSVRRPRRRLRDRIAERELVAIYWLEPHSEAVRWTIFTTLFIVGGGLVGSGLVSATSVAVGFGSTLMVLGAMIGVISFRMGRAGYCLAMDLIPRVYRHPENPQAWQIDVIVENMGRTDDFSIKVEDPISSAGGPASGTYLKWKGHGDGDWKRIEDLSSATARFILDWHPSLDSTTDTYEPDLSTVAASTGAAPFTVGNLPSAWMLLILRSRRGGDSRLFAATIELSDPLDTKPVVRIEPFQRTKNEST